MATSPSRSIALKLFAMVEAEITPAAAAAQGSARSKPPSPVDLDLLFRRLGGDADLVSQVLDLFVLDCPARLAAIQAAFDRDDVDELRRAAHALKGVAGSISATELADHARILEQLASQPLLEKARLSFVTLSAEAGAVITTLRRLQGTATKELQSARSHR